MSYYYLGQHKDNFIVLKQSHSFAEASDKLQVIDCSGRVNCEFEIEPDQYRRELMFSELGDGIIYCDNYFINTNTWDLIERSESSDLYAHEGSYFIAFGTTSWNFSYWSELDLNDVSSQSSYDSLYSAWRENKPEETEIDLDTFGEGKYIKDGVFLTPGGKTAVKPDVPDTVKVNRATRFQNGYALLYMTGADGVAYISAINDSGTLQYDPKKLSEVYEHAGYYNSGYLPLAATHSTPFTGVLAYDGRQLTIGEDDLSELGDLVLRYEYDDGVPILKDGCFCGSHLDPKDHGIDQKTDFYLSTDGRKIISEAYEYELVY